MRPKLIRYWLACIMILAMIVFSGCTNQNECSNRICSDDKVQAQGQDSQLSIIPSEAIVNAGESFSLEVSVANAKDLFGYQFSIAYEPGMLEFQSIEEGGFLSNNGQEEPFCVEYQLTSGLVKNVACTKMKGEGLNGSGALKKITFKALKAGSSPIALLNAKLVNSKAETIPLTLADGKVTVN